MNNRIVSYAVQGVFLALFAYLAYYWVSDRYFTPPEALPVTPADTIYQTVTVQRVDTVTITKTILVPGETIKTVVKYDTLYIDHEQVQSEFTFNPEPFRISALTYAHCRVDSIQFAYSHNPVYWNRVNQNWYNTGYSAGMNNFPAWKKYTYMGCGVIFGTAVTLTILNLGK